jgi:hypothetical protein
VAHQIDALLAKALAEVVGDLAKAVRESPFHGIEIILGHGF